MTDLLHCQLTAVSEGEQVLTLHVQFRNGSPQIFKPKVPEHCILHGTLDAIRTGRHRFKLTFTQVPCVLLFLRLFSFSILLKEVCDLLWH